jgi:hypothetical protein
MAIGYRVYRLQDHTSGDKKLAMLPKIFATVLSLRPPG